MSNTDSHLSFLRLSAQKARFTLCYGVRSGRFVASTGLLCVHPDQQARRTGDTQLASPNSALYVEMRKTVVVVIPISPQQHGFGIMAVCGDSPPYFDWFHCVIPEPVPIH